MSYSSDKAIVKLLLATFALPFILAYEIIKLFTNGSKNNKATKNDKKKIHHKAQPFFSRSNTHIIKNRMKDDNKTAKFAYDRRDEICPSFENIQLNTNWHNSNSINPDDLPTCAGVYAEIHWPSMGVRIGETGRSIRGKIKHDIRWFNSMHDGTAPIEQLRRTLPIAQTAKAYGASAFSFYVVSQDPRLEDKELRQKCERFMFQWIENNPEYINWNFQKSWH